jgi:DNA-binding winged helix-turn-helix (wHTH) protein
LQNQRVTGADGRAVSRGKLSPTLPEAVSTASPPPVVRFGVFQLDVQAGQLLRNGRVVRLKPQPFKLLQLLVSRAGDVVTREEIRDSLWGSDTFVDFEQGVNSAIKQVREALGDDADRPLYLETLPKRGYRFTAQIDAPKGTPPRATDLNLQKALWLNVAELRLAEQRRRDRRQRILLIGLVGVVVLAAVVVIVFLIRS